MGEHLMEAYFIIGKCKLAFGEYETGLRNVQDALNLANAQNSNCAGAIKIFLEKTTAIVRSGFRATCSIYQETTTVSTTTTITKITEKVEQHQLDGTDELEEGELNEDELEDGELLEGESEEIVENVQFMKNEIIQRKIVGGNT